MRPSAALTVPINHSTRIHIRFPHNLSLRGLANILQHLYYRPTNIRVAKLMLHWKRFIDFFRWKQWKRPPDDIITTLSTSWFYLKCSECSLLTGTQKCTFTVMSVQKHFFTWKMYLMVWGFPFCLIRVQLVCTEKSEIFYLIYDFTGVKLWRNTPLIE